MSELTLKEAIEHLENELNNPEHKWECVQCKKENEQVLNWLKALKIIKKKNVMVFLLKVCESVDEYNSHTSKIDQLTQEEFDLLKRWTRWLRK